MGYWLSGLLWRMARHKTRKPIAVEAAVALALSFPLAVHATDGYFSHGYGSKSQGIAGGGIALPQDALAAATNPAGTALVGDYSVLRPPLLYIARPIADIVNVVRAFEL